MEKTLQELADFLHGTLENEDPALRITGVNGLVEAGPTEISFAIPPYVEFCHKSRAGAMILAPEDRKLDRPVIRVSNPKQAFAELLESLNWDWAMAQKARIAVMFPSPGELAKRTNLTVEQVISLTDGLYMGHWLQPVLRFLNAPVDNNEAFRPELERQNCLKAAELALIVNRYTSLLKEKQDRELTFSILKRESTVNHYNREVLKQLEEILRAEQILENIK